MENNTLWLLYARSQLRPQAVVCQDMWAAAIFDPTLHAQALVQLVGWTTTVPTAVTPF